MKRIKFYLKIWIKMAKNAFLIWFIRKSGFIVFLSGKLIRYFFYFLFLIFLVNTTQGFAGFTKEQIVFFASTYVLIDTVTQFLFRSVYSFRPLVITGDLDLILIKPVNPLFRVLMGGPDFVDLITIPPIIALVAYTGWLLNPSSWAVATYVLLCLNAIVIASALHIVVLAFGIITLEVDHSIMVYRDISSMGRFPVDIYKEPLRSIITFLIPIGTMITVPAKGLMGLMHPVGIFSALIFGVTSLVLALRFWQFALKKYSSASS